MILEAGAPTWYERSGPTDPPRFRAMFIQTEPTSDSETLKFLPGRTVLEADEVTFGDGEAAQRSPLAARLFQL
ncbi:MAG: NifU N-terminal domain-containing protein, partial [Nitrospinota bacterium]